MGKAYLKNHPMGRDGSLACVRQKPKLDEFTTGKHRSKKNPYRYAHAKRPIRRTNTNKNRARMKRFPLRIAR